MAEHLKDCCRDISTNTDVGSNEICARRTRKGSPYLRIDHQQSAVFIRDLSFGSEGIKDVTSASGA